MEKKPNTYSGISKSVLKTLNRNFYTEPLKDENRISEIMSEFITGELDTINSILSSNEILNFKDQTNQTLVLAILRNESPNISEENKLEIIQKLISDKNVSLNTMTNYNQNPLHLACQKGYCLIIDYMIKNGCDQTLIDNYGNAPIHYLIDKFIRECSDNDFYSQSNQQIKETNSTELKKINDILKNESILLLLKLLSSDKYIGVQGPKIIDAIKKFTKNKIQSSLPVIYELIEKKIEDVNKIFLEFGDSKEKKIEKAQNIIYDINNDVFQIYGLDLDFKNIIWDNFLEQQLSQIKNKKDLVMKNIFKDIQIIKGGIELNFLHKLEEEFVEKIYKKIFKFTSGIFFVYHFLKSCDGTFKILTNEENGNLIMLNQQRKDIIINSGPQPFGQQYNISNTIDSFTNDVIKKLFKQGFQVLVNGLDDINNIDSINLYDNNFLDDESYAYQFCFDDNGKCCQEYLLFIKGQVNNSDNIIYIPSELGKEDNFKKLKDEIINLNINIKEFNENEINDINNNYNPKSYYIYSSIRILIQTIKLISTKIINLKFDEMMTNKNNDFTKYIQQFCLFDVKYLTEYIFKIINNLIILEKYIDDMNIEEINNDFNVVWDELIKVQDKNFQEVMNYITFVLQKTSINEEFIQELKLKKYADIFDQLYDTLTEVLERFKELIKKINEYFSLDQLEKYNEFLRNKPNQKEIDFTIFNNYHFDIKYPLRYKEYKSYYFKLDNNTNLYDFGSGSQNTDNLLENKDYKKDLITEFWSYDNTYNFNMFYIKNLNSYTYDVLSVVIANNQQPCELNINTNTQNMDYYKKNYNTFSRGYDVLKLDNTVKYNLDECEGKEEKKILCEMDIIKNNSDYNTDNNSVNESDDKIVSWKIVNDSFKINNINDVESYIITNNLGELINMLVYSIYEVLKVKNNNNINISDAFFGMVDLNINGRNQEKIGIDLNYNGIDDKTKKNIEYTLDFIQNNPKERQKYLFDNIKSFVKIILFEQINKEIFSIMDEIKITNSSKNKIITTVSINEFNKDLKQIDKKYKDNFKSKLKELIQNLQQSPTLVFQEILDLSKNNKLSSEQAKILNSKCLNKNKTDELMSIEDINYRVLDQNGNTILIRLIEQFNIYGIKKLIEKNKKILFTYKNNNLETPLDYISSSLKNIQTDYFDKDFKYRMNKYSLALENSINSNDEFKGIEFDNSNNLVTRIITNSIYLFNETIWLKIYSYPSGWTVSDKNDLKKKLLEFTEEKFTEEKLLINSFDDKDNENYINSIKSGSETKILDYVKILQEEINELKNRSKELKEDQDNNSLLKQTDNKNYIDDNIKQIIKEIYEKEELIKKYQNYIENIGEEDFSSEVKVIDKYQKKLLDIKNFEINWNQYTELLNNLDDKYIGIIGILNDKCEKSKSISNHLIKIYCCDINNKESNELIKKYFKLIFEKMFNDYWDLDRYENSDYNIINKSIIEILKINVVGIIKNELINTLINYVIQVNKNKSKNNEIIIKTIKSNKDLTNSIKTYLYESLIKKLKLNNPDKSSLEINIDEQKIKIISTLKKILILQFDETEENEIKKIIEFNKFVCENISLNCYEEIIKILYDGKKISMFYEIYNLIYDELEKM